MKDRITEAISGARSLPEVQEALLDLVSAEHTRNINRIGIISGIVSSEGMDNIPQNMVRLQTYTALMGQRYSEARFFSAADVFTAEIYANLPEFQLPRPEIDHAFMEFWRGILGSGFISDVSFTPRWRKSVGATDEHVTVTKLSVPHQFVMQPKPGTLLIRRCCEMILSLE